MGIKVYKNTLLIAILFGFIGANAQKKFDLAINEITLELDSKTLVGYVSQFDFSREEVRRGWWKYSRQFGNPIDMREYYQVRIPSQTTDGNVDLTIYSQTIEEGGQTYFKVGLGEEKYKDQIEELLKGFKKDFYIQYYLEEIKLKELAAESYSDQYESALQEDEKSEALDLLDENKQEIERLKIEIRKVEGKEENE